MQPFEFLTNFRFLKVQVVLLATKLSVFVYDPFQLLYQLTYYHKTWYENCVMGSRPKLMILISFIHEKCEIVRWP